MQVFPLYSIGKSLSAAAVVALGCDVESSVGDLIDVPEQFRRARLLDVLRHRAGLPDYGDWPDYRAGIHDPHPWQFAELMDRATRVTAPALGAFHYSNVGYAIIRRVLEEATGKDFFGAIHSTILEPLGITEAAPFAQPRDWQRCVKAESDVSWYHPGWVLTGTIAASPAAAETIFKGVLAGELFPPSVLLDTLPVEAPGSALPEPGYALGLMTSGAPSARFAGHGGAGPGYTAFVLATADGHAASAAFAATVTDQNSLIRRCFEALDSGTNAR